MSVPASTTLTTQTNVQELQPNLEYVITNESIEFNKLHKNGWVINNGNQYSNNDQLVVLKNKDNKILAVINSYPASKAKVLKNFEKKQLRNCWFIDSIWLSPDVGLNSIAPLAVYITAKTARIYNKDILITIKNKKSFGKIL